MYKSNSYKNLFLTEKSYIYLNLKQIIMEVNLDIKYQIGDVVFLKTDTEQNHRIVTAICIRVTGVQYELGFGHSSSWHYDIEITKDKDILKKILSD